MPARSILQAAALAACLAAAPALAGSDSARCSIPRAASWRTVRSAHFTIATDLSREKAGRLVRELEKLHAAVLAALFGEDVEVPARLNVVAFSERRRFEEVAPRHAEGYVKRTLLGEPLAVFPYDEDEGVPELLAHELAHHVSYFHFPRQPRWFAEGLAQFVETVARERKDERSTATGSHLVRGQIRRGGRWAGLASPRLAERVRYTLGVSAAELLAWRGGVDDADPGRFHTGSWVLYHFLWNQRSEAFTAFQERLAAGEDPDVAWRSAFPEWDPARPQTLSALDAALAVYRKEGRYAAYAVDVTSADAPYTEALLATADLHGILLDARARGSWGTDAERETKVAAEVGEALREDPANPLAVWHDAMARKAPLAPALRAVTAARPDDWRGWVLLGDALDPASDAREKEAALRRSVALEPASAHANNELAWLLVTTGRAREARPFAERALDLAPWNPTTVDTLAAVAFGIGQCQAAVMLQRRAAGHFALDDRNGDGVRKRLAEYEARCGAAAIPTR